MTAYPRALREAAEASERAADWTADVTSVVGLGALAAHGNPNSAAYFLFAGGFFKLVSRASRAVANDPPRRDFELETYVRPRRIRRDVFGPAAPSDDQLITCAASANECAAYLEAARVAFERQQGALRRRRRSIAYERGSEAARYAEGASRVLRGLRDSVVDLRHSFEKSYSEREWDRLYSFGVHEGPRDPTELPADTLARLYVAGVRIDELTVLLQRPRREAERHEFAALSGIARAFEELADAFAIWHPPSLG